MHAAPTASYTLTLRLEIENHPGMLGRVASAIGDAGGDIGAVDLVQVTGGTVVRDITVKAGDDAHGREIVAAVERVPGVRVINVSDRTFLLHLGGKVQVTPKIPLRTRDDLSMAYTPGVARVCMAIAEERDRVFQLTIKRNTVAVVTDGTAVLGLGDIGPEAALPVMEGKAMLFKEFGGVDAFPICLATRDVDEIVRTVTLIAPAFGGINLEDIAAPRCFAIEERLQAALDIPVFHDDQHGTAVVVLAALFNALKLVDKRLDEVRVVINGVGAAGVATTRLLRAAGVRHITGCDRGGILYPGRPDGMNPVKEQYARDTNPEGQPGTLHDAIVGADVFIGVSSPGVLGPDDLRKMARDPIVFALANPTPEILPEQAQGLARIMATGRSDYPNQINNVLAFPGIFRGALDCRARAINTRMLLAAAHAIAGIVGEDELHDDYIVPSVFNRRVVDEVAAAVITAAQESGLARRAPKT